MNPFSSATWLWRALRGQSVTFAALFALALLGLSVVHLLRHVLASFGVPWLALLILPALVIGYVARRESEWLPDVNNRRRWSRRLVFGSIGLALVLGSIKARFFHPAPLPQVHVQSAPAAVRVHRPSGK